MDVVGVRLFVVQIGLYWYLTVSGNTSSEHKYYERMYNLCPSRNFCRANATQLSDSSSCMACSCVDTCLLSGNCCPDKDLTTLTDKPQLHKCVGFGDLFNVERFGSTFQWMGHHDTMYKVIHHCDTNRTVSERTRELCEHGNTSFVDMFPVSSRDGQMLFKNKYCALCHGVSDVIYWNLNIFRCKSLLQERFSNLSELNDYIMEHCPFTATPTALVSTDLVRCDESTALFIYRCNVTRKWDNYDVTLANMCTASMESYNAMYTTFDRSMCMSYSNVFCYLCNVGKDDVNQPCELEYNSNNGYMLINLAVKLDAGNVIFKNDHAPHKRCHSTHGYDPYFNVCRELFCSFGTLPHNEECKSIADLTGVVSAFLFKIYNITVTTLNSADEVTVLSKILVAFADTIHSSIRKSCSTAKLCGLSINKGNKFYYVIYNVTSEAPCKSRALLAIMKQFKDHTISLNITTDAGIQAITLQMLNTKKHVGLLYGFIEQSYVEETCERGIRTDSEMMETCPMVQLSMSVLENSTMSNRTVDKILRKAMTLEDDVKNDDVIDGTPDDTLKLCLSDYLSALNEEMSSTQVTKQSILCLFSVLTLGYILS